MAKILLYTFNVPSLISYKLVGRVESPVTKYYLGRLRDLEKLVREEKFDYVLGVGNYSGGKNIRIENLFVNKYGKRRIQFTGIESYRSNWKLEELSGTINSNTPTNGPCNRSAYKLIDIIEKENLFAKFAFIHIPKNYNFEDATKLVCEWLYTV